jgi:periplasmic copper chaperone A
MSNRKIAGSLVAAALCALPVASASAHVTVQPKEAPAGEFKRLDVRVPNERDDAGTKKVDVQFPDGFYFVSYEPVPGWKVNVLKEKLPKPVDNEGEKITEQVDRVIMTAEAGNEIEPGQFRDFGLSVGLPEKQQTLTFKAIQTYDSGEIVRWIGAPDADEPAPQVTLTDANATSAGTQPVSNNAPPAAASTPAASSSDSSDSASKGLGIAALVIAIVGLLVAIGALAMGRRRTA